MTTQLTTLALWLLALVLALAVDGLVGYLVAAKRGERAELPVEWQDALKRTYGGRK